MIKILNKNILRSEIIHITLLLIVIGAIGYIIHDDQNRKIQDLASKNNQLSTTTTAQASEISSLESNTAELSQQNINLQNQIDSYRKNSVIDVPQPKYSLQINSAKHLWSPALLADETYTFLVIDVTIVNNGEAAGYVSPSDFTVKDNNSVGQQTINEWAGRTQQLYLPPPQPTALDGQALHAGDTVRGSLIYHVVSNKTTFVLKYGGDSYPIAVTDKITW